MNFIYVVVNISKIVVINHGNLGKFKYVSTNTILIYCNEETHLLYLRNDLTMQLP